MTKRTYYLYLGYYMNLNAFYCTQNGNIYVANTNRIQSKEYQLIFVFLCTMLYVIGRNLQIEEIPFSIAPIIGASIVLGIILGVIFSCYIDRKNQEYFAKKEALKVSEEQKKKLIKQAKKITWIYTGFQIFVILLAVIEPILILEVKDLIMLGLYFIMWFTVSYCILQLRIFKRWKMIRDLSK